MICEVANFPLTNNGVLGDVLQILFTWVLKHILYEVGFKKKIFFKFSTKLILEGKFRDNLFLFLRQYIWW